MKHLALTFSLFLTFASFHLFAQYEVYVTSGNGATSSVKKFDATGNYLGDFIAPGASPLDWPQDILFINSDTEAIVSSLNNNAIFRYDGSTGAYIDTFASTISGPTRMKIGQDGLLYVLEWGGPDSRVLRFDLSGNFIDTFTNITVAQSIGIAWDAAGSVFITSFGGADVFRFDATGIYTGIPIIGPLNVFGPTNIWFDAAGDIIILDWTGNKVRKYNAAFVQQPNFINSIPRPEGYVYLPNGELLIGSGGGAPSVRRYDSNGNFIDFFATGSGLENPNAICLKATTAGLNEQIITQGNSVSPSMGTTFYVSAELLTDSNRVVVFNVQGELAQELIFTEGNSFELSELSSGTYFVFVNGAAAQKIIVE